MGLRALLCWPGPQGRWQEEGAPAKQLGEAGEAARSLAKRLWLLQGAPQVRTGCLCWEAGVWVSPCEPAPSVLPNPRLREAGVGAVASPQV